MQRETSYENDNDNENEDENEMHPTLRLPDFDARVRLSPTSHLEEIWDTQRHRWVRLTPEEWVRQHFVNFLIKHHQYPTGRIGNEVSVKVGQLERRCDTVVFGNEGHPIMIVEYKSPAVSITQKVFDQIARYNIALQVDWLIVSNGLQHYCCHLLRAENRYEFVDTIPPYQQLLPR